MWLYLHREYKLHTISFEWKMSLLIPSKYCWYRRSLVACHRPSKYDIVIWDYDIIAYNLAYYNICVYKLNISCIFIGNNIEYLLNWMRLFNERLCQCEDFHVGIEQWKCSAHQPRNALVFFYTIASTAEGLMFSSICQYVKCIRVWMPFTEPFFNNSCSSMCKYVNMSML